MSVLLLRLAGPLQSWGSASRFARRGTESAPTKSGVAGLLAAAQGRPRDADLSDLAALRFGVRIDQPGSRLRDFHTAHHSDSGKSMPISDRFYLADAVFVAGFEGDAPLLQALHQALLDPRFLPYLGRRSCPPSRRIDLGPPVAGPLEKALRSVPWQASHWYAKRLKSDAKADGPAGGEPLSLLVDCSPAETPDVSIRDLPLSFDAHHRQYGLRGVRTHQVATPLHDPVSALGPPLTPSSSTAPGRAAPAADTLSRTT